MENKMVQLCWTHTNKKGVHIYLCTPFFGGSTVTAFAIFLTL